MSLLLETKNNVSQQWQIIKILETNQNKTQNIDKLVTDNGTMLTNSKAICNDITSVEVIFSNHIATQLKNTTPLIMLEYFYFKLG